MAVKLNTLFGVVVHFWDALYLNERICRYNYVSRIGIIVKLTRNQKCCSALDRAELHLLYFFILGEYLYFQ